MQRHCQVVVIVSRYQIRPLRDVGGFVIEAFVHLMLEGQARQGSNDLPRELALATPYAPALLLEKMKKPFPHTCCSEPLSSCYVRSSGANHCGDSVLS